MRRKHLLAKSLSLGMAVALTASSLATPGGVLSPLAVYAESDEESTALATLTITPESGTVVTTTEETAEDGTVTVTTMLENASDGVNATVISKKDADGNVTEASAAVTQLATDKTAAISASVVSQIVEAAGTSEVVITWTVVNEDGKNVCKVTVNAAELTAGGKMAVLKINKKTGELTLINASTYTVAADGSIVLDDLKTANYMLVTKSEANAFSKEVLSTVKAENEKVTVKAGKKTTLTLDDELNMDNVKKITYSTTKKSVATVNKNGKVTTKKARTVTIKAKVTLKNGKTKTVKMKVIVKN